MAALASGFHPLREAILSGWLEKKGRGPSYAWRERYFVLMRMGASREATMNFYKTPWKIGDTHAPQGTIKFGVPASDGDMDDSKAHKPYVKFSVEKEGGSDDPRAYFDVCTPHGDYHVVNIRCGSERERAVWVAQINALIKGKDTPAINPELLSGTRIDIKHSVNIQKTMGVLPSERPRVVKMRCCAGRAPLAPLLASRLPCGLSPLLPPFT